MNRNSHATFKRNSIVAVVSLCAGLVGAQAVAQGALEEVVVTAQKRAESLQDVPITISAITGNMMKDMGISTTQDLQLSVPGLVFPTEGVLGQIYLRGVGTRFSLNGLDPSIAQYVGDRYSPRGSGAIAMLGPDVDRVEVLKGPQGILYGRNATGGAIRIIKKPVTDELEGDLKVSYGNHQYTSFEGTVSVPVSDTFGMRLSAQKNDRDGLRKNLQPNAPHSETDDMDTMQLNGHFRWDFAENSQANLYVDYWKEDDLAAYSSNSLGPDKLSRGILFGAVYKGLDETHTATDSAQPIDGDQIGTELNLRFGFDNFDLVSVTTYADFDLKWTSEGDGTGASLFTPAIAWDQSETWSQEIRLNSTGDGDVTWTVGGFYYEDKHKTEFAFNAINNALLNGRSQGHQTTDTEAWAAFGQVKWAFMEDWALTVGARYSYEKRDSYKGLSKHDYPVLLPGILPYPFEVKDNWDEVTPQVTLEYNFDNAMVYLTYSRGFKSGGVNYPNQSTPNGLDPEILDMYELGMKGDFADGTLRVNAAVFFYDYTDLQVQRAAGASGLTTTDNAADAEVLGFDLDLTWVPTEALTIRAGLNILDSEYKEYPATEKVFTARFLGQIAPDATSVPANYTPRASCAGFTNCVQPGMIDVAFDASGHDLLRAPKWSAFTTIAYEFDVGTGRVPVSLTYSYKDDFWYDFSTDPIAKKYLEEPGYGLLSARISYVSADDSWRVSLWGTNLTKETYFNETAGNAQSLRGYYGEPRMYGVDVEYSF